jgi:AcrR family transcriptional regulator
MSTEKRRNILDAAMRLFVEKGIHATPTSQIAREAEVATGTLFHHFRNKEELVDALYHSIYDSLLEYKEGKIDPDAPIRDQLRTNWLIDISWGMEHREYFHFLERYSFLHYMSESEITKIFDRFQDCVGIFRRAIDAGQLASDDIDYVREHFVWNIRMNMSYCLEHPECCTPEQIEKSFQIYWKGICRD